MMPVATVDATCQTRLLEYYCFRSYIETEEARRATLGLGEHTGSLELEDNEQLAAMGEAQEMDCYRIYRKDSCTGKIAAGGIWVSKSGENPPVVAEHPDVTPTDVP